MTEKSSLRQYHEFAALISDLETGYGNRRRTDHPLSFALDANVVWFYLDNSDRENQKVEGYMAQMLGITQVAGLVRRSIDAYCQAPDCFYITESHKYEADSVFVSAALKVNYEKMRTDLDAAFSRVLIKSRHQNSLTPTQLSRVIDLLQEEFEDSFDLLLDVNHLRRPSQKFLIDQGLRPLTNHDSKKLPDELHATLQKVACFLREGEGRQGFAVAQDIRALRDVALHNARRNTNKVALLTFDRRLISIVRLMQSVREPWAQYLALENCETFWLWNVGNALGLEGKQPQFLAELIDDFRRKSSFVLTADSLAEKAELGALDRSMLAELARHINRKKLCNGNESILPLLERIDAFGADMTAAEAERPPASALVDAILGDFFKELRRLIPSVNLASSGSAETRKTFFDGLRDMGFSKEQFMTSLDDNIREHAERSFSILGASSMLAPKTVQALQLFIDSSSNTTPGTHKFIHRLPLPIQADIPELNDVLKLVSEKDGTIRARYERLLKIGNWRGAIADLVIAYLYASCGLADEAERICGQVVQAKESAARFDQYYFEATLLRASILRIHKTSSSKLAEARQMLLALSNTKWAEDEVAASGLRLESELLASGVNNALLTSSAAMFMAAAASDAALEEHWVLLARLYSHRNHLLEQPPRNNILHRKLLANVRVNIILLQEFILLTDISACLDNRVRYHATLEAVFERISDKTTRLSYFEEVVSIFALLRNGMATGPNEEIELAARLSNRLGWVLQRRERLNDFEYRIFVFVKQEMSKSGYT